MLYILSESLMAGKIPFLALQRCFLLVSVFANGKRVRYRLDNPQLYKRN